MINTVNRLYSGSCILVLYLYFMLLGPISTTPEMPTAADMQLAAAVGSRGEYYEPI